MQTKILTLVRSKFSNFLYYYEQWCELFEHFKKFYVINHKLELYIK